MITSLNAQNNRPWQKDTTVVYGCIHPRALNYDSLAQKDDGSCIFKDSTEHEKMIYGCMDSTALNYNPYAKYSNDNCIYERPVYGCTDSLALNYNPEATRDNGLCKYEKTIWGCTDSLALNYKPEATKDNGNCIYERVILGCTDKTAINYNPKATQDNGNCIFVKDSTVIYGCTDPEALNYNKFATNDNGNCKYVTRTDSIRGCMDTLALNYNPLATISNDHCVYTKDSVIYGCKSKKALNYNPNAKRNDGSCVFARPGSVSLPSLESLAGMKDTVAVLLEEACDFDYTLPIDTAYIKNIKPLGNNIYAVIWTIIQDTLKTNVKAEFTIEADSSLLILSLICKQCPLTPTGDGSMKVISTSSTSVNGVTVGSVANATLNTGLSNITNDNGIKLYPNPVRDQLNVIYSTSEQSRLNLTVYSIDGRRLMQKEVSSENGVNTFELNTSTLDAGMHFLTISSNGVILETIKFSKF